MNAQEGRQWILDGIYQGVQRIFVKYGDGEYLSLEGSVGQTINGDYYCANVREALREALHTLAAHPRCAVARWPDDALYADLRKVHGDPLYPRWADYTTLLLQKGNEAEMLAFWDALRTMGSIDYVAPLRMAPVAAWLGARHIMIADSNAHPIDTDDVTADIVLVSAGFGAKPLIASLSSGTQTLLDVGSGLDILVGPPTREGQPDHHTVRNLFGL